MFFRKKIYHLLLVSAFFVVLTAGSAFGATRSVPGEYATIQAAIDAAADGDVVEIADGIYTGTGNRDISFKGKAITVRSKPEIIDGVTKYHPEKCIIDCQGQGRGFNFINGEGETSRLIGVTIQNGSAEHGAGIYILRSSAVIENCIIQGNHADRNGGGVYCFQAPAATLQNGCIIRNNSAGYYGGGVCFYDKCSGKIENCEVRNNEALGAGGGIYLFAFSNVEVRDTTVTCNSSKSGSELEGGGGIFCFESSYLTVTDSVISYNNATSGGGGIGCLYSSSLYLERSDVIYNDAGGFGGGVYVSGYHNEKWNTEIKQCRICSNTDYGRGGIFFDASMPLLENTLVSDNLSGVNGTGIYINNSQVSVNSCTIAGNSQNDSGYGIQIASGGLKVVNSIIWGHDNASVLQRGGTVDISYSDIQETWSGTGNISVDPLFIDSECHLPDNPELLQRLILTSDEALIGTDDEPPAIDLAGNPRPTPPHAGAYEFMTIPDFNELALRLAPSGAAPTGEIAAGYELLLNPVVDRYYLDIAGGQPSTTLKPGVYPFYLTEASDMDTFSAYWNSKELLAERCLPDYRRWQSINLSGPLFVEDFADASALPQSQSTTADYWIWNEQEGRYDVRLYYTSDENKFKISDAFGTVQGTSFTLAYDFYMSAIQTGTGISLGLGRGPADTAGNIQMRLSRTGADDPAFTIEDGSGNIISSPTLGNIMDAWYHVVVDYDQNLQTVSISVTEKNTDTELFSQQNVPFSPVAFDQIWIGDHTVDIPDNYDHYIKCSFDNITITSSNQMPAFYLQVGNDANRTLRLVDGPTRDTLGYVACAEVPDDGRAHDTLAILKGNLNNTPLATCMPEVTVYPGEQISGEVQINVHNIHASTAVFPAGWTISWGHSNEYVYQEITGQAEPGDSQYTVSVDATAPLTSGTYYITFACGATDSADNLFASKCGSTAPDSADWNETGSDANDIASLGENAYCLSNWQHWLEVPGKDADGADCLHYPGIAMIKVNVLAEGASQDAFILPGDYPAMSYTFKGRLEGENGVESGEIPLILTVNSIELGIRDMELVMSADPLTAPATWGPVSGTLAAGYALNLDPEAGTHYLDIASVQTAEGTAFVPGTYAFGTPAVFYLGITESAPGTYDYGLYATEDRSQAFFRLEGTHPEGIYDYIGQIPLASGGDSETTIRLNITSKAPVLTGAYTYPLALTPNFDLAEGEYAFFLKMTPDGAVSSTTPAFILSVAGDGTITVLEAEGGNPWEGPPGDFGNYLYTGTVTGKNGVDSDEQYILVQVGNVDQNEDGDIGLRDAVIILQKLVNIRE